jgi:flagellar biosynthesis protein FlhF
MREALALVRTELGPEAAVLQTREVRAGGLLQRLAGARQIEVTASRDVRVPSRFAPSGAAMTQVARTTEHALRQPHPLVDDNAPQLFDYESAAPCTASGEDAEHDQAEHLREQLASLQSMVENLYRTQSFSHDKAADEFFDLYTKLIDVDISESSARDLVDRLPRGAQTSGRAGRRAASQQLVQAIEDQIAVSGPIVARPGERRIVALVGPTGVGKTTTIAKLAANYRLREKCKVALITVDTYRIAAVEQLRTYADIIDLPMEVVATPKEMRAAIQKFRDMELILIDTAGRSPRDEVKIHELKSFLADAQVDEVHLVLSTVASTRSLRETAERFQTVGTTSLLLTKIDEATVLGPVFELLRSTGLPVSYITNGQNVPDDIEPARARRLANMILPVESDHD